jgi:hypothetical protein
MALAQGQRLSGLNEPAGAIGVVLEIHVSSLTPTLGHERRQRRH